MKEHVTSLLIGLLGGFALMHILPNGSTDRTIFGFYECLFLGIFISYLVAWIVKYKKPKT